MSSMREIQNLESLLQEHLGGKEILKIDSKMLTAPGENYGSVMLAIDVTLENEQTLHLVAKLIPANDYLCEVFNIQVTFKREIAMYAEIFPALGEFEAEHGKSENYSNLFAKCYGARINSNPGSAVVDKDAVLLLENLKILGYDTEDRLVGFDAEQMEVILANLAVFHATPVAFRILQPDRCRKMVAEYLEPLTIVESFDETMQKDFVDDILQTLSTNSKFVPYFDRISKTIIQSCDGSYRKGIYSGAFCTLIHTDFWTNNTMVLKNTSGRTTHNKIVDLQTPIYGPNVLDLLFFLYSSGLPDLVHQNPKKFIRFYHQCFLNCLSGFNIDTAEFSWEKFEVEIKKYAELELGHILIMIKPILMERGAIKDMSEFSEEHMFDNSTLHPSYTKRMVDIVESFISNNWLVL